MNTGKYVSIALLALVTLFGTGIGNPAQAVTENSVFIDTPVLSRCNEHFVAFSGTATYNDSGTHHLLIDLDGVPVYSTFDEPQSWSFLHKVSVGTHTLTARIHDDEVSKTVDHAITFDVKACETGEDVGPDCCPGPDPVVTPTPQPKPVVKGATTSTDLPQLAPLNSIFRSVFGRTPTFTEWKYWADRFLTDKSAWDQILGAMQWHKLHGVTIGK